MQQIGMFVRGCLIVAVLALTWGCGGGNAPELGYVEGTVTMDGKPLKGALVTFYPQQGGRPSFGRTNENGWYELVYTNNVNGALPGEHSVAISTKQSGDPDQDQESVPEKVPAKYNVDTELTATVKADSNEINFELDSEGEIIDLEAEGDYGEGAYGEEVP